MNKIELYYISINIISFLLFIIDKHKAIINSYRIPEKTLLLSAFLGGSLGAFIGMNFSHHKTKKYKFKVLIPLSIILHIIILLLLKK